LTLRILLLSIWDIKSHKYKQLGASSPHGARHKKTTEPRLSGHLSSGRMG